MKHPPKKISPAKRGVLPRKPPLLPDEAAGLDYNNGGYLYDAAQAGAFIGFGFRF